MFLTEVVVQIYSLSFRGSSWVHLLFWMTGLYLPSLSNKLSYELLKECVEMLILQIGEAPGHTKKIEQVFVENFF